MDSSFSGCTNNIVFNRSCEKVQKNVVLQHDITLVLRHYTIPHPSQPRWATKTPKQPYWCWQGVPQSKAAFTTTLNHKTYHKSINPIIGAIHDPRILGNPLPDQRLVARFRAVCVKSYPRFAFSGYNPDSSLSWSFRAVPSKKECHELR